MSDTAGQTLQLTYHLASDDYVGNTFSVKWDGATIAGSAVSNLANSGYVTYTFDVLTTGSDTVTFLEGADSSFWGLDDVSLDTPATTTNVPEPGSLPLFGTALLLLGAFGWRRAKNGAF